MSAHRFIYMLAGILLLLSCGSDNNAPIDDPGNTTNHYLQLQPNGLNAIKVSCTEENFVFPFQIKAVGNGSNQGGIIRKSKFPQNPKRSVRFSGKRTKRSVQKRKARNTQKAETKVL